MGGYSDLTTGQIFYYMLRSDKSFPSDIIYGIQGMTSNPKVFISYTWTSEEHKEWVRDLADELIDNGVNVILDQYDLREGDDINHFMETSIADSSIDRVIVISDKKYTEKANNRDGGSGYEAGIISLDVARRIESNIGGNKICPIVVELNENGEYCLPTYLDGHNAINMIEDYRHTNFEQLLRWIYNKKKLVKPELGTRPTFLDEENHGIQLHTRGEALNAKIAIEHGKPNALSALDKYLTKLESGLSQFENKETESDIMLVKNMELTECFVPYEKEFLELIMAICKSNENARLYHRIRKFFETMFSWRYSQTGQQMSISGQFAHYKLFCYELFISTIALCLHFEGFDFSNALLKMDYTLETKSGSFNSSIRSFGAFCPAVSEIRYLFAQKNSEMARTTARHIINRLSSFGTTQRDLVTADLFLKIVDTAKHLGESDSEYHERSRWNTLIATVDNREMDEINFFRRCISKEYLGNVAHGASVDSEKLLLAIQKLMSRSSIIPWDWVCNPTQWGTRP